ncbi:hypothetical protein [Streptomyces sp. ME19-01-6]|uniref:hypothetical protein n=1 Tax=Streptomyces sp. ME19-01-6 TaxID=3028686 RepID=UPI0029A5B3D1|nr:hypothetical protein [Streptomyces sp. ME19-01-6]MDX3228313.1 hypothetical protein [Streptomyces sp. ME19-01-6]
MGTPESVVATEVKAAGAPPSQRGRLVSSLMWGVSVPLMFTVAAWLAQFPSVGIYIGVVLALGTFAVAATVVGGIWHRAGAAVLVSCAGFALTLFAGPGLYELYMKTMGEKVPAVVVKVEDRDEKQYCTVKETAGDHAVHEISQQQNCFDHIKRLQRVTLSKDPMGVLEPRLPDGPDQEGQTALTLAISGGLFVVTGTSMFYAGQRRR